jgi:iron transport multicopper oxidase
MVVDSCSSFAINGNSYVEPKVPTLYTVLGAGHEATNPVIYGQYANPYIVSHNDVVEIVVNNGDSGGHPIHMHGHNFQMVERSPPFTTPHKYSGTPTTTPPATPARRDVMKVQASGYLVYRFRADNPGVWAFHCHIDWHLTAGFFATIIEAPLALQGQSIPANHIQACKDQHLPYQGNAAGNTQNYTDLTGANNAPPVHNTGAYCGNCQPS